MHSYQAAASLAGFLIHLSKKLDHGTINLNSEMRTTDYTEHTDKEGLIFEVQITREVDCQASATL